MRVSVGGGIFIYVGTLALLHVYFFEFAGTCVHCWCTQTLFALISCPEVAIELLLAIFILYCVDL